METTNGTQEDKLSMNTETLIKQRRKLLEKLSQHKDELKQLNKDIIQAIKTDIRDYNNKWVISVIEENKGMRVLHNKISKGRAEITKLRMREDK